MLEPSFIVGDAVRSGQLIRILTDWQTEELAVYAVYASARHLSSKVRRFVDDLAARFGGTPYWD